LTIRRAQPILSVTGLKLGHLDCNDKIVQEAVDLDRFQVSKYTLLKFGSIHTYFLQLNDSL